MTLRSKLNGFIIALMIFVILIFGATTYFRSSKVVYGQLQQDSLAMLDLLEVNIQSYFEIRLSNLNHEALNPDLLQIYESEDASNNLMSRFISFTNSHPEIALIGYGTSSGDFIHYPPIDLPSDYDPRMRPWYDEAIAFEVPKWTEPYADSASGESIISATIPVFDGNGVSHGVIIIDMSLAGLSESIASIKIGNTGSISLIDKKLNIMIHSDKAMIGKSIENTLLLESIENQYSGLLKYVKTDLPMLGSFKIIDDLDWTLLYTIEESEISDKYSIMLKDIIVIGILIIFLATMLMSLFTKKLVKPLKFLSADMEKVKNGDFTVQTKIITSDEIGTIGSDFNNMLEHVRGLLFKSQYVVGQVQNASYEVSESTIATNSFITDLNQSVDEIAKGTLDQASNAENGFHISNKFDKRLNDLGTQSHEVKEAANLVFNFNKKVFIMLKN